MEIEDWKYLEYVTSREITNILLQNGFFNWQPVFFKDGIDKKVYPNPTFQSVLKWFRDVYQIFCTIDVEQDENKEITYTQNIKFIDYNGDLIEEKLPSSYKKFYNCHDCIENMISYVLTLIEKKYNHKNWYICIRDYNIDLGDGIEITMFKRGVCYKPLKDGTFTLVGVGFIQPIINKEDAKKYFTLLKFEDILEGTAMELGSEYNDAIGNKCKIINTKRPYDFEYDYIIVNSCNEKDDYMTDCIVNIALNDSEYIDKWLEYLDTNYKEQYENN